MSDTDFIKGNKTEILDKIGTVRPDTPANEQMKAAIMVHCSEDIERALASLERSMNRNADSSDSLASKVFWLNIVLTAATIGGVAVAFFKSG